MPGAAPIPSGPDPALSAEWQRCRHHAEGLFTAIDKLDEMGGVTRLADQAGWSPAVLDRAIGTLLAARESLTGAIARLEARRRHFPRRRRIG